VGGAAEDSVEVVLELEGREVQRQTAVLPPNGASGVIFDAVNVSQDHTRGVVRITEADDLAHDDRYFFVLSPGRSTSVLILEGSGRGAASSLFLTEALRISEENTFEVSVRQAGSLSEGDLQAMSVLVVNDRSIAGGSPAEALRTFVEAGGGLLVVLGEGIRWPQELSDLLPGTFTEPVDREDGRGGRLGFLDYDHPVFEVFRGPRSGDFTGARFFRARNLQVTDGQGTSVLARFDDGSPALVEKKVGEGRVLVWASTLDSYWNDLAQQPIFLPFAHKLMEYASGRRETVASFTAGQILDVSDADAMATAGLGEVTAALAGEEERVAFTPSGASIRLPAGESPHYLHLDEQGVYDLRVPGNPDQRPLAVAVNVDLGEADLGTLDTEEVAAALVSRVPEGNAPRLEGAQALRLRLEDQERRQSLWRFLLLVAFVLLGLETVVSNRISRTTGKRGVHAGP
jgi:hypothetical protein